MRRVAIGGVALAAALVLVGCTGPGRGPTTPTVTSSASPTMPDLDQFTPPPSGLVDEDTGEAVEPQPVPEWDEASRVAVVGTAGAAMTAAAPGPTSTTTPGGPALNHCSPRGGRGLRLRRPREHPGAGGDRRASSSTTPARTWPPSRSRPTPGAINSCSTARTPTRRGSSAASPVEEVN